MSNAWDDYLAALQKSGDAVLKSAPDEATRVEGIAYLARLAAGGVQRFLAGPERFVGGLDFNAPRIGGFNPDYRLATANVAGDKTYRFKGKLNQAYRIGVGIYSQSADGGLDLDDYIVLMAGKAGVKSDGSFDIEVSPNAASGAGLRTTPTTNLFIVRELMLEPGGTYSEIVLEGGPSARGTPFTTESVTRGLMGAQYFYAGSAVQFMEWSSAFAELPNTITPLREDFNSKVRGDPGTDYYTGYFHLRDDQALVVDIPKFEADYWGFMLANHWQETLPASYVNHVTAKPNSDGTIRVVIAARDPGEPNWLPTDGRSRGVIWHRRINCDNKTPPKVTLRG